MTAPPAGFTKDTFRIHLYGLNKIVFVCTDISNNMYELASTDYTR